MLITNRPEISIRLKFRAISRSIYKDFVLHKISAAVIRHDITIFLRHKLDQIKEEVSISFDWPDE